MRNIANECECLTEIWLEEYVIGLPYTVIKCICERSKQLEV
jgi:hypothetical protein